MGRVREGDGIDRHQSTYYFLHADTQTKRLLPQADAEDAIVGVGQVIVVLAVVAPAIGGAEVRTVAVTSPCSPG